MSTRRTESDSLASGILIVGILGGSLCCTGEVRGQTVTDHPSGAPLAVTDIELSLKSSEALSMAAPLAVTDAALTNAEFSLKSSAVLSGAASRPRSPKFFDDRSSVPSLAVSPMISTLAASGESETSGELPVVPFDERPLPFDPTSRGGGSGGADAAVAGPRRVAESGSEGGENVLEQASEALSSLGGFGWGLAPLRWGGTTGVQMSRNSSTGGASSSDVSEFLNLRGASYIYQPWLAQISGNLNLMKSQAGSSSGASASGDSKQSAGTVTGGGAVQLLANSRFPFSASFDRSNSRTTSDLVANAYTNSRYSMRQSYRPEDGSYSVQGGYDHSALTFTDLAKSGNDTVNSFNGGFTRNQGPQRLQADANISRSLNEATGDGSRLIQLNSQFAYQLEDNLSYNSMSSITDTTFSSTGEKGRVNNHGRYMQFNSYVNWQPEGEEEDIPLFVTGGVRTLSAMTESGESSTTSRSIGGNVSANYIYSPNLSFNGNGLVTQVSGGGSNASQLLSVVGGGATYSGDPLAFGKFSYNWSASGHGSRQSMPAAVAGAASSNMTLSGQLNHGLSTSLRLSDVSTIYFTGTQALAEITDSGQGNTATLTHTAGANYTGVTGENIQAGVGINYSDTLTSGRTEGHYRYLNVLLNGQLQFNTHSSAGANLSFQWSASDNPATPLPSATGSLNSAPTKQSNINVYGSANYQNQRAFGFKGLRYNADFIANTMFQNDRLMGNAGAAPVGAQYSLNNRLTYRIGLLDFESKFQVNTTAGRNNALIFFRAYREFGGY